MSNRIILLSSLIAITSILAFSGLDQSAYAATDYVISDDTTGRDCITLEGTWDDGVNTCTFTNEVTIDSEDSFTVDENVTVVFQGGTGNSSEQLDNDGTMEFVGGAGEDSGELDNFGTVNNSCEGDIIGTVTRTPIIQESPCIPEPTFCGKPITEYDSVMEGTDNDDILQGTKGNDLIFGNNGNDCHN